MRRAGSWLPPALALLLGLGLSWPGCRPGEAGPDAELSPSVLLGRDLAWRWIAGFPHHGAALSWGPSHWGPWEQSVAALAGGGGASSGRPGVANGRPVVAGGRDRLALSNVQALQAELGDAADPELYHALVLRARCTEPGSLEVWWHGPGEEFGVDRRVAGMALVPDGQPHDYLWRLSMLRGRADAADAGQGLAGLRIVVRGAEGPPTRQAQPREEKGMREEPPSGAASPGPAAPPRLDLEAISLRSDFDALPGASGPPSARMAKRFAFCRGVALPVGAALEARLPDHGARELRLLVGCVGGRRHAGTATGATGVAQHGPTGALGAGRASAAGALQVRFDAGAGEVVLSCAPDQPWRELVLPLTGAGGTLRVWADGSDPGVVLLLGRPLLLGSAPADQPPRPDVVLYVEDTLRADRLSTYGYGRRTDPYLASMAAGGALMQRVLASANWTRPAMASVMTSLPPPAHGNRSYRDRCPESLTTLAEAFAADGYLVCSFVSNYHAGSWAGLDQGVDLFFEPEAFGLPLAPDTRTAARIHPLLEGVLEAQSDLPLLLLVHSLDPHTPYAPDPADLLALAPASGVPSGDGPTAKSLRYDAEILGNDHWLEQLDLALERHGLLQRSVVSFLSDHGESFGEHGAWEHHDSLYLPELWVPWIVRWPGHIGPGTKIARWTSQLDVAPTLCGLAGVPRPEGWDGVDLSAALVGGPEPPPAPIFAECLRLPSQERPVHQVALMMPPYKLLLDVADRGPRPFALHDLRADPGELHNLLGEPELGERIGLMTSIAARVLERGGGKLAVPDADHDATPLDPARTAWLRQMGYLR